MIEDKCTRCGEPLKAVEVHRPVWIDGCIGTGEVRTEIVWYCPKCQSAPRGKPIHSSTAEEIRRDLW